MTGNELVYAMEQLDILRENLIDDGDGALAEIIQRVDDLIEVLNDYLRKDDDDVDEEVTDD